VNEPSGIVEEEGAVLMLLHECQRLLRNWISREALSIERIGRARVCCGEVQKTIAHAGLYPSDILPFDMGGEVKAEVLWLRLVIVVPGDMPFASMSRRVAIVLERLRQRWGVL